MKRSIGLALVAALALAIGGGGGTTAATAATDGGAQAAAKKGKKKAAKCKTAKKKGKASADAAAKKGKKKGSKCKAKAKPKGKAQPKPPAPPAPKQPDPPAGLTDGQYRDSDPNKSLTVTISGGVTHAAIRFVGSTCAGAALVNAEGPIGQQGSDVKGSQTVTLFGGRGTIEWTLTITPATLAYRFDTTTKVELPDSPRCEDTASYQGTLTK